MKHISDLFSKYTKTITPPQASVVKEFVKTVESELGLVVVPEHCEYRVGSKTLYFAGPSLLKSEIMLQKNRLLSRLKDSLGRSAPREIV